MASKRSDSASQPLLIEADPETGFGSNEEAHRDRVLSGGSERVRQLSDIERLPQGIRALCSPRVWRKYLKGEYATLTIALVVLVLARTCDQTLYYRLSEEYRYFVWYFSSVILATPISFIVVWYKMWFRPGDITPAMRKFPQYKFAIMGLFDTTFNVFSTFPIQHLGGDLSNVLSQTILPINMVGSFFFLKTRYRKVHYWGAILVVYGIMVKLSPSLGTPAFSGSFGWILLAVLSNIPSAASNVYKETGLKADDLDVWYANAWIALWQILWGALTFWTVFIPPFVAPHPAINISQFPTFVKNANQCFFGESVDLTANTTAFHNDCITNGNVWHGDTATCTVNCDVNGTPIAVFCIYICFNLTYNVLSLYVFKKGSSVLFVVANAVRLPLVDALNSVKFVSGVARQSIGKYDYFSLVSLVMAIFVYYSEPDNEKDQAEEDPNDIATMKLAVASPRVPGTFRNRSSHSAAAAEAQLQRALAKGRSQNQ